MFKEYQAAIAGSAGSGQVDCAGAADDVVQVECAAQTAGGSRSCSRVNRAAVKQAAENCSTANAADCTTEQLRKLGHRCLLQRRAHRLDRLRLRARVRVTWPC